MSKKILFTFLLLLTLAVPFGAAADRFYLEPADLELGKTETLSFMLENDNDYYGFQAEVKLPTGLQAVKGNDGNLDITLSNRAADGDYKVNSNVLQNGTLIMGAFSGNHRAFSRNQGVLVNLKVTVAESFTGGDVEISNVKFINRDDQDVDFDSSSAFMGVAVTGISLNKTELSLEVGKTETLTLNFTPESATDKSVSWSSSSDCAEVSNNGVITAWFPGLATITATTSNGLTAECTVTVTPELIEVTSIELSHTELTLTEGEEVPITVTISPENATDKTFTWSSSNENCAYASTSWDGYAVYAVNPGTAIITATSINGVTATCHVTVNQKVIEVTGITLSNSELSLTEGETATLTATIAPENATDKSVSWSTSDSNIATVSAEGVVTAVSAGTATITATSTNGTTASCSVTVAANIISVESISISDSELSMTEGDTATLTATITPDNATDKTVTWTSSDAAVATVSAEGVVTAVGAGTATITASSSNGKTATCSVKVAAKVIEVTGITLDKTELSMTEGDTATLTASITPDNATDKTVSWSSSDASIAVVSDKGVVTAVKAGTATITATSANGKTATCSVTVAAKIIEVTGITLSNTELKLTEGDTATLTATIAPENATDKTVTWTSSDEAVATVSVEGVVTAVGTGTATITAASSNGKTATCSVKVAAKVIEVTGITLDKTELSMTEGDTATLTATIAPENATDKTVTWTSSDESVATVSDKGVVTAVKAGKATITATSANGKTATCSVTVAAKIIEVTGITLSNTELKLNEGATATLTATIAPENATDKSVTWSTSDASIATVSDKGVVTAVKAGTATITATSANGKTATCSVTVAANIIAVESIAINKTELSMTEGDTATLTATITPDNATDKTVTWTSSDEAVATVSAEGVVTAIGAGTATITAASSNGKTATCSVKVAAKVIEVTGVTLDKTELSMTEGDTANLTATIAPENATDKTVTWSSSDESIATVSDKGVVTAVKAGKATITATSANGKTATCSVTVAAKIIEVTGITLSNTELKLNEGATATLTATIAPENATDKTITWSTSDAKVATVSDKGVVTAVKAGTATITATSANGKTATCSVTVAANIIAVESIAISKSELSMTEGDTATLTATITPENATDKTVTWTSSDAAVATVSAEGVVTAVGAGTATITAASSNGKTATCSVKVAAKVIEVTGITLDKTELTMTEGDTATLTATIAPENATDKTVTWTSSDESIATVSDKGVVTAVKAGTATITATSANGKTAACSVTVAAKIIEVTGITLSNPELKLNEGATATLTATIAPENATDKTVTWSTSDAKVATVSDKGVVTAVKAGTATITATSSNGKTATCSVTVAANIIAVESIALNKTELSMTEGDTTTLTATITPDNATDKTVTWTSSDAAVATVSAEGVVTAVGAGSATITAASSNGKTATCSVTVAAKVIEVTGITLNKTELSMTEGDTATLTANIAPENATDKTVTWTSSDESIATVSDKGVVNAVKAGKATITATSANGKTATCAVTVAAKVIEVTAITLNSSKLSLTEGETATLTASIAPENATDKTVTWSTSDASIATVSDKGVVTAVKAGTATITATSANGKTATCEVTVNAKAPEVIAVTSVALDKTELSLTEGDTATLTATIAPENATDKTVTWSSSDESIATVSDKGVVTAVKAGKATITATSANGKTATCEVTVAAKVIEVTGITLDKTELSMTEGDTATLTATIAPKNATDKTVTWTSSDEAVATVSDKGVVTAVKAGKATITATSANGKTSTCAVTVAAKVIEVTGVTLDKTELSLTEGDTATLIATIAPENATDKTVTWTSSDESVATVSDKGVVTAVKAGTATITATSANGKTATCEVTVAAKVIEVTGITLNSSKLSLTEGETATLTASIAPENATDKTVTWSTSDAKIATVSAEGVVTAVKAGTATITATSANGKTATCEVTVTAKAPEVVAVTSVALDKTELSMTEGDTATLTATIAPENATDKTVTWTSSDESVATVSDKGVVTAVKAGKATITATSANGKTATCEVTVAAKVIEVTGITLNSSKLSLTEGDTATLTATIAPENATDKTVTWSSSDESVATVSAKGVVTAVKAGKATITATSANGKTATCEVTVAAKVIEVTGITLNSSKLSLTEGETATLTASIAPENASDKTVTWSTSDASIATVSDNGVVTAVKAGTATITATSANGKTATCEVTVTAKTPDVIAVTSIALSSTELSLLEGENATLTATIAPENATDKTVTWSSSDESVATVSDKGVVTAIKAGKATVTATSSNGKTANCEVTVLPIVVLVESLDIDPTAWTGEEGSEFKITATVLPENATDKRVAFESTDTDVATVDAEGNVSVIAVGTCSIIVTTLDGSDLTAECAITSTVGVAEIFAESDALVDVYDLKGNMLKHGCKPEELKQLAPGMYIMRSGNRVVKTLIR